MSHKSKWAHFVPSKQLFMVADILELPIKHRVFYQYSILAIFCQYTRNFQTAIDIRRQKILTKRRANVTNLQVYANLPLLDSEHSESNGNPITQPLMVESDGYGNHKIAIIQQS